MANENTFIEHRWRQNGDWYGTSNSELQRIKNAGKIPIIEVDVQGAMEINK